MTNYQTKQCFQSHDHTQFIKISIISCTKFMILIGIFSNFLTVSSQPKTIKIVQKINDISINFDIEFQILQ